jgi:ATP-dependent exoDNAse (exonuclease V) alpha subunit
MALNKSPRPRRDLVSAGSLGPIQRRIRLPKEASELGSARCFRSHANADGELGCGMLVNKRPRFAGLTRRSAIVVPLTEVFRQAAASRIIINAHRINQGTMPDLSVSAGDSDFYFVPAEDPGTAVPRIVELVKTRIPKRFGLNSIRDIQVLCPMNRGGVGARSLNIELQAELNPAGDRKAERFGWTFAPSDKVMQIENDYDKEVYNGDIYR